MHNLDRTRLEADFDDELEYEEEFEDEEELGEYEFEDDEEELGELEGEWESSAGTSVFDEGEEMELALELLEVSDDAELEMFFGRALRRGFRKLKKRARRAIRGRLGRRLRRGLRSVARRALKGAGRAAGGFFGGPVGAAIGGRLASGAGRAFGLELEGMSPEDQEFEVARRVVRMTGEAALAAADMPEEIEDDEAARGAVQQAVRRHAPGLARGAGVGRKGMRNAGRWIRRGRRIVLMGV
ncbi:hypothetical protein [Pelagibius sp. Alg239-R121]|uniref:hypothetical protein n=1 Tax=Pelagibius sp. Alg239-R121 TaxID=2993448 RepID=UPI0024A6F6B9|nr:hypothetical protein [Pelagibius sp. Alg239-R121]